MEFVNIVLYICIIKLKQNFKTKNTNTMNTQTQNINALELLVKFANAKPCLNFADYGEVKSYRAESREITKDLHDFRELLTLCSFRVNNLNESILNEISTSNGRLTIEGNKLQYITGQYFPTEYRPAANFILKSILWKSYAKTSETGQEIRAKIKKIVSRRVYNNYFA